jgi:hypothetical protein
LRRILAALGERAFGERKQCQRTNIARVRRHHFLGGIDHLGAIASLLISAHQKFQRVFLHHAVGILGGKSFQPADHRGRIGLLRCAHVRVVFGGILDFFLLLWRRLPLGLRLALLRRRGRCRCGRGSGLGDGGSGYQYGREKNLLHVSVAP